MIAPSAAIVGRGWLVAILLFAVAATTPAVAAPDAPRRGGTLATSPAYGSRVSTLDPHRTTLTEDDLVALSLHRSLYRWDAARNAPALELAKSVSASADGRTFHYVLRDDVYFHNGRRMTAADLLWSYHRVMSPGEANPGARYLRSIEGAAAYEAGKAGRITGLRQTGAFALDIRFNEVTDPGYLLFWPMTSILPREEVTRRGAGFATHPVGLGPFRFVRWVKGSEIVVDRFDRFYRPGRPWLDRVVYRLLGDDSARDFAFRSGELDFIKLNTVQLLQYSRNPKYRGLLVPVEEVYTRHIGFNPRFRPTRDIRVRQAINHAIDSRLITERLLKGMGVPAQGWLPPILPTADPALTGYAYDPARARRLLREAGYPDGFEMEILATPDRTYGIGILEAVLPYLKKVGIIARPKLVENAIAQEIVFVSGDFDAYIWSFNAGPDPLAALRRYHSGTPNTAGNYIFYNNARFDALLDAAGREADPAVRLRLLKQANAHFTRQAPLWFFSHSKAWLAQQPWVHGLQANSVESMYQYFDDVWLSDGGDGRGRGRGR